MTKKIRKAIVISLVYEIALFVFVLENVGTYYYDRFIITLIMYSIPVFAYWAWVFIKSGDSSE